MISGEGWSISDEEAGVDFVPVNSNTADMTGSMIYTVNGTRYAIRSVSVEGTSVPLTNTDSRTWQYRVGGLIDATNYKGKPVENINYKVPDSLIDFHMPYNDVTITVTWGPVSGTEDEVKTARESALAVLKAAYDKYDASHEKYAAITAAYEAGVDAVNTAKTVAAVTSARTTALQAMETAAGSGVVGSPIEGWGYSDAFDAGLQVGTVTVSFENTTYDDGFFYYANWVTDDNPTGAFVWKENYPLGENDNMMTVALRALADEFPGATWNGTGGTGFGLTYLNGIKVDDYSLEAFNGGNESGWMGTLNDWFTNLGFNEFTVESGKLGDGDYIRIMYTTNGYGADLGGTWGNSDTTIQSIAVEGGELLSEFTPGIAGGSYEYTLLIDGNSANLKLTPTASNKNFLTKIFLNEKVTSNTEGGSFYKRTQYIPVTSGDTIYVGCGARAWPSMNNQEGNTQDNDGTWYVLHVVNADDGSSYVVGLIDELPDTVRYENYTTVGSAIDAAEAAYEALSDTAKQNVSNYDKLAQLKAEIESFAQIDAFKKQLAAIPNVKRVTLENQEAIEQAQTAYDALTAEQKEYLTRSETEKMAALTARLAELIDEADHAAAAAVDALIDKIGTVTLDSEADIAAARTAYDALTPAQKKLVSNYQTLLDAEKRYDEITAPITPVGPSKPSKPSQSSAPDTDKKLPFTDVAKSDWYYDGVKYAYENGLMNGTGANAFNPGADMTRGMIVTILSRLEGVNTTGGAAWYEAGREWAMQNGISDGTNMDGKITREQLAAMLYRYAKMKGYNVSASASLSGYTDASSVSGWAKDAMQWAVGSGLIQGSGNALTPQANASRAQIATILMRFAEKIAK